MAKPWVEQRCALREKRPSKTSHAWSLRLSWQPARSDWPPTPLPWKESPGHVSSNEAELENFFKVRGKVRGRL